MARIWAGLSQEQLGARVGVSFQQVQKYENGKNRMSLSRAWQFSVVVGVPVEAFFQRPSHGLRAAPDPMEPGRKLAQWLALYRTLKERKVLVEALHLLTAIEGLVHAATTHVERD